MNPAAAGSVSRAGRSRTRARLVGRLRPHIRCLRWGLRWRLVETCFEPPATYKPDDDDGDDGHHEQDDPTGPQYAQDLAQQRQVVAQDVAEQSVERRPRDATTGIPEEEAAPRHAIDAGKERHIGAQQREEAPQEDRLVAVPREEFLGI